MFSRDTVKIYPPVVVEELIKPMMPLKAARVEEK
jgi:hypothetical protein